MKRYLDSLSSTERVTKSFDAVATLYALKVTAVVLAVSLA